MAKKTRDVQVTLTRVCSNVEECDGMINLRVGMGCNLIVSVDLDPDEFTNMMTNRIAKGVAKVYEARQ